MTAVRGPFVFTSDQFRDDFITKAKSAGCGALALQLGVAGRAEADKVRASGLQIIGWGACDVPALGRVNHALLGSAVWMPQAENTGEFEALVACLQQGVFPGPTEPVMTSGGMEPPGNPTPAEKVAERKRRINLLNSFGITKVWVEVYKQDADRSGQTNLGDVNHMCDFFISQYGFEEAHPVLGLWTVDGSQPWGKNPYSVSNYDLSRHGRAFGAWRAEQMADERYPEMAAVPPLQPPKPPPKKPVKQYRAEIEALAKEAVAAHGLGPHSRLRIIERIASEEFSDAQWRVELGPGISDLLDQAKGEE